jgi:hypothetical protein
VALVIRHQLTSYSIVLNRPNFPFLIVVFLGLQCLTLSQSLLVRSISFIKMEQPYVHMTESTESISASTSLNLLRERLRSSLALSLSSSPIYSFFASFVDFIDSLICACGISMFMRLIHANTRGLRKHPGAADSRRGSGEYGVDLEG